MKEMESTWPLDLERPNSDGESHGRAETNGAWSFRLRERLFAPLTPRALAHPGGERSAAANTPGSPTFGPREGLDVSNVKPLAPTAPSFGKRGFAALYQWEGVVEEVNGEGFRARLLPFEGEWDVSRVEYADFDYGDLADESDRALVANGAIFYWTVGKSRNAAGTYTNTSLVRFRRLPAPTQSQTRDAAREAAAMMADLGA